MAGGNLGFFYYNIIIMRYLFREPKAVEVVRAADVLEDYELEYIQHVLNPQPMQCYRNAHLLCEAFPDRFKYCEGRVDVPVTIDHAFNKVDDVYIDITFEFALHEDPTIYDYVAYCECDAKTIRDAALEIGYYGGVHEWLLPK